jgi:hypothetical protein
VSQFANQLKAWGIGQTELARMIGRDPRTVRQWCADGPPIIVSALLEAARQLGPTDPKSALVRLLESVAPFKPDQQP